MQVCPRTLTYAVPGPKSRAISQSAADSFPNARPKRKTSAGTHGPPASPDNKPMCKIALALRDQNPNWGFNLRKSFGDVRIEFLRYRRIKSNQYWIPRIFSVALAAVIRFFMLVKIVACYVQ